MTTPIEEQLPKGFRILSPVWLATNPLPEDAVFDGIAAWIPSSHRGQILPEFTLSAYTYASATDLPAEAFADSQPTTNLATERAEAIDRIRAIVNPRELHADLKEANALIERLDAEVRDIAHRLSESQAARAAQTERADKLQAEVEERDRIFSVLRLFARRMGFLENSEPDNAMKLVGRVIWKTEQIQAELDAARKERDATIARAEAAEWYRDGAMRDRDKAEARNADLERGIMGAIDIATGHGEPMPSLWRVEEYIRKLLSPQAEQKLSNDSSGVEGHAGEQKCDDPTAPQSGQPHVSTERVEIPSNAPSSVTEPSENQASPAVTSCTQCGKPRSHHGIHSTTHTLCDACSSQHSDT